MAYSYHNEFSCGKPTNVPDSALRIVSTRTALLTVASPAPMYSPVLRGNGWGASRGTVSYKRVVMMVTDGDHVRTSLLVQAQICMPGCRHT